MLLTAKKMLGFLPVLGLFISYIFGVAVELLGDAQIYLRISIFMFCIVVPLLLNLRPRLWPAIGTFLLSFFCLFQFLLHKDSLVLNFVYLSVVLLYFDSIRLSALDLVECCFWAVFLTIIFYFILYILDLVRPEWIVIGGRERFNFGFVNPNKVGFLSYSLFVLSSIYFSNKNFFLAKIFFTAISIFLVLYCDSRTALYSMILFCLFSVFYRFIRVRKLLVIMPVACLFMSLWVSSLHENEFINHLLSFRPIEYNSFLKNMGAFDYFIGHSTVGFRIDNSYILALFSIGLIGVVYFIAIFFSRLKNINISLFDYSLLLSLFVYGLLEGVLVRVEFPVVLLFYYVCIYSSIGLYSSSRTCREL